MRTTTRLISKPITVKIDKITVEKARTYAKQVVKTVDYSDTNQTEQKKVEQDHFVSKIGEEAVKKGLAERGQKVIGPDYKVYVGKKKSWAPDLIVDGKPLAVKTQRRSEANRYGLSWTFQCAPTRRDTILDKPDDWVCFVEYDDTSPEIICRVYAFYQIKELTFKEPALTRLKGLKKVVYAKDLPRIED